MKRILAALAGVALLPALVTTPSRAGTATASLGVTANVANTCTIAAAPVAFGAYDTLATTPTDITSTLTVRCTAGAAAAITLGQGLNSASGSTDAAPLRRMLNTGAAGQYLAYYLYRDSGRSTVWGNTVATGVAYTGTGLSETQTVYARLPPGQNVVAGTYSDTVVATITY